ncbi:MAG: flagellar type III secretion system pore protein FliP [Planctomycetota bacterium]
MDASHAVIDPGSVSTWPLAVVLAVAAPFVLAALTSFAKLAVVGGLLRLGLGAPGVPPTSVIVGLAVVLSAVVLRPVAEQSYANYQQLTAEAASTPEITSANESADPGDSPDQADKPVALVEAELWWRACFEPVTGFWLRNSSPEDRALFEGLAGLEPTIQEGRSPIDAGYAVSVLAPAFLLTELTEAFAVGVLVLLPFLVIDLAVSTVLASLGMPLLSPTVVALPFKLLLFVLADGWGLVFGGLLSGYG